METFPLTTQVSSTFEHIPRRFFPYIDGGILEGERLGGGVVGHLALDARDGGEVGAVRRGDLHVTDQESVLLLCGD